MNERDKARNVFGNSSSNVGGLSDITSDMWTPISSAKPADKNAGQVRPPKTSERKPAENLNSQRKPDTSEREKKQAQQKSRSSSSKASYVTANTGYKGTNKQNSNDRISATNTKNKTKKKPPEKTRSSIFGNILSSSDNNKKRAQSNKKAQPSHNTFRTMQKESDVPSPKRTAPQKQKGKNPTQLTKRQMENLRKDREMYEQGRKSGKSKDEIRRAAQQKKLKKRKLGMIMTFAVFILTMVMLLGGYIYYEGAIVENIAVEGKSRYSAKEIIASCGVDTGDNLLGVREKDVRESLTEKLPYIKDVEVKFTLPDTVVITVSSTADKMLIANKNKYLRLDMDGKVLSASKTKMKDGVFKIEGLTYKKYQPGDIFVPDEKDADRYEVVKQIITVAETSAGLTSGVINVADLKNITIVYDSRIKIYLGTTDDLESKLSLAMRTIKEAASENQTGYVDMRFSKMGYFSEGSMDNK